MRPLEAGKETMRPHFVNLSFRFEEGQRQGGHVDPGFINSMGAGLIPPENRRVPLPGLTLVSEGRLTLFGETNQFWV